MNGTATLKRAAKSRPAGLLPRSTRTVWSGKADIVEIRRLAVDAPGRRRDPACHAAGLDHRARHQRLDIAAIRLGRQPLRRAALPFLGTDDPAIRCRVEVGEDPD